ncbi:MAG: carbohydrate ABC transporter permease [Caldilineaceae bacterium]|nr:carbohydrate ABC transporter permease [Caldilineaceae bacterium]MCB0121261.1 carbohydrate ABC transporter permease [Caldilineaceae bacterium]
MATQTVSQQTNSRQLMRARRNARWRSLGIQGWSVEILKYVALLLLTITFLLPFYWMVSSAVKTDTQVYTVPPVWFPVPQQWNNFWDAWNAENYWLFTYNTVIRYALPATVGTVLSSCMVAYSFSRLRWIGRDTLFAVVLATLMIPNWVRLVPLFIIFKQLGWLNTFLPLVVPHFFGNAFFIFLLRQFFMGIPTELSDAAKIDGANEFAIMFRIILPLSVPALAVVALFTFMDAWNDYLGPLIFVNVEDKWVLALGVQRLRNAVAEIGNRQLAYPYLMAVSSLITLPIFLAFFFAQRTFIEGISVTGLKG